MDMRSVTVTMIFEGSALNRDEKIGGNVLSIKKLQVHGRTVSFISKPALRHYLFSSLQQAYAWPAAKLTAAGGTIQFDLEKENILTSPELDTFGYMFTSKGKNSLVRKSPLGITKAVGLEPYLGDMAFYANHDFVRRIHQQGTGAKQPDPYSKEENINFYKVSFTLDANRFGRDEWYGLEDFIQTYPERFARQKLPGKMVYDKASATLYFEVDPAEKSRRALAILETIRGGLHAHTSGESNTIVPLFLVAAAVRLPSPVFHGYIDLRYEGGAPQVIGLEDAIHNPWIEGPIYLFESARLKSTLTPQERQERCTQDWPAFLAQQVGLTLA